MALGCSKIVHIAGGYPAGQWSDVKIARECLVPRLNKFEQAAADLGYQDGDNYFLTSYNNPQADDEKLFKSQSVEARGNVPSRNG